MSRVRRQQIGVALFPFLAVLICTMGALIVLLVLMVAKAGVDAKDALTAEAQNTAATDAAQRQLRERQEDADWRREMLAQQRVEKTQQLADSRQALAHLEDHIRRLEEQAKQLLARAKEIDAGDQSRDQDAAAARAEIERLQREIAAKQLERDEQRKQHAKAAGWFALIPYNGPNGTRRRPIYIECTREGVILQPEGVVLSAEDFKGPLGPGNPLDAALRAIREHLAKTYGPQGGEPYPLLVVRPSGIVAYGVARSAMRSWEDEFGYELISNEKKLAFGTPDPALSDTLLETIAVARQRQEAFIASMPRRYNEEQPLTSFAPESLPDYEAHMAASGGGGASGGASNGTSGNRGTGTAGPSGGRGADPANGIAGGTGAGINGGGPSDPYAVRPAAPGSAGGGANTAGNPAANPGQATPNSVVQNGTANRYATSTPSSASGQAGKASASQSGGEAGGSSSVAMGMQRPQSAKGGSGRGKGKNWGIPGAKEQQTGITRPIRVVCLDDRVIILPERGDDRPSQEVRVSREMTAAEIDAVVAAVQKQMKNWGLAVSGGYWKPQLNVEVAPNAEPRFAELQTALQGSGYDLQRKIR